jgi:hypothetical protein
MKNIWLAFFIISVLFSCKSKTNSKSPNPLNIKPDTITEQKLLIEKFSPIIQGNWVISNYVDGLTKTRSPYKLKHMLWGAVEISIYMTELKSDSISVGESLNNHEGTSFMVYFKKGHGANCLKTNMEDYDVHTNFYELGYHIKGTDTSLFLYHINKNNKVLDSVKYTRVLKNAVDKTNAADGINYITNKKLFAGKYDLFDISGKNSTIEFDSKGSVYGFLSFTKYYINTDFVAGPANNIDDIVFDLYTNTSLDFAYKLDADTIKLYHIDYNADSTVESFGQLQYKLVKHTK